MGGDGGPAIAVAGGALALNRDPGLCFTLFGDEAAVRAECARHPEFADHVSIVHTPDVISGEDKPSQAIRRAKTTSMGLAIADVKAKASGAALSAGNTGALMAMS